MVHKITSKMTPTPLMSPPASPRRVSDCDLKIPTLNATDCIPELETPTMVSKIRRRVSSAANEANHQQPVKKKRRISFDRIEIIELPIVLGDHPCVQDGPPVSVCWIPQLRISGSLDRFEQAREPNRRRFPVRISAKVRRALLAKHGFSQCEMDLATIEAKKVKLERYFSLLTPPGARLVVPDAAAVDG